MKFKAGERHKLAGVAVLSQSANRLLNFLLVSLYFLQSSPDSLLMFLFAVIAAFII